MKPGAKFVVFFLSAAVLACAWFLAGTLPGAGDGDAAAPADPAPAPVDISLGGYREMTALSWSWDGETVNLERDPETGRWVNADDAACPVDDAAAERLAKAAAGAEATPVAEGVTDLAQFGLESPELTVMAATETASACYEIGNRSITGEYYLRRSGEDTVYLERGDLEAFRVDVGDIIALERMPEDIAMVTGLSVRSAAETYELEYLDGEGKGWYRIDGEKPAALEEDRVQELYGLLTGLTLTRCVSWSAAPEAYGLDTPQAEAELRYITTGGRSDAVSLAFGDYAGGDVYVRFTGSDMVYLVPGAVPDALMYPRWETMMPMTVMNLDTASIAKLDVLLDGKKYGIARLEETVDQPVGEKTVSVTDVIYSLNGWVLDTDDVEKWLASLADLPSEGPAPAGEGRETFLSVAITWKDPEAVPAELELRFYDSVHDLCVIGGDQYLLVPRDRAEEVGRAAESLFAGER